MHSVRGKATATTDGANRRRGVPDFGIENQNHRDTGPAIRPATRIATHSRSDIFFELRVMVSVQGRTIRLVLIAAAPRIAMS